MAAPTSRQAGVPELLGRPAGTAILRDHRGLASQLAYARRTVELARRAEAWGFDGLLVADSQNPNADVWIELGVVAAATERIRLGPGVTNPATRHPAVTAWAAATLQLESGGRAVVGLGRGDSLQALH